jgi:hypothetical protein
MGTPTPGPILYAVGFGLAITQFVLEGEASMTENLLAVGAPIAIGSLAAELLGYKAPGPKSPSWYITTGLAAGAIGVGAMMAMGALPVVFDGPTFGTLGLVAVSVAVGEGAHNAISSS